MITFFMISGLHNPIWLNNILSNFNRQVYPNKHLVIVENGNGNNLALNIVSENITIIKSKPGVSNYINTGIKYIKQTFGNNNDWIVKADADDYYGPFYLYKLYNEINKHKPDYLGRKSIYVKSTDNKLWLLNHTLFHGPTLAAKISSCLYFPEVTTYGEDALWCELMDQNNKKSLTIEDPHGFCYQRWNPSDHTWPCTDTEIRTAWQVPIIDLGDFDIGIIEGNKLPKQKIVLEPPEISPDTFLPFRLLKEQSNN